MSLTVEDLEGLRLAYENEGLDFYDPQSSDFTKAVPFSDLLALAERGLKVEAMLEAVEWAHREAEVKLFESQQYRKSDSDICFEQGWTTALLEIRERLRAIAQEDQK